jgi:hypothetical protein
MVLNTVGAGRWDPTCVNDAGSLPHFAVGSTPNHSERSFASGNERTPADLEKWAVPGKKAAYYIKKSDSFRTIVDLMNMNSTIPQTEDNLQQANTKQWTIASFT